MVSQTTTTVLNMYPVSKQEISACWELCRLHKNIGFWLLWLPVAWSITMAYHAEPTIRATTALSRAALYIPLCFGMKSMVLTIDDIFDSDIDGKVERTKNRPLPRGAISKSRAYQFLFIQFVIGIYLATKFLNPDTLRVSTPIWPLFVIYPTCKRWTNLAPIALGIILGNGVLMGWVDLAVGESISWTIPMSMYGGSFLWTIVYETVYQHEDKVEDRKLGLHSMALLFGAKTVPICAVATLGFVALFCNGGMLNQQGLPFYIAVVSAGMLQLVRLLDTDVDKPEDCERLFRGTPKLGQIILVGLVVDAVSHRLRGGVPF